MSFGVPLIIILLTTLSLFLSLSLVHIVSIVKSYCLARQASKPSKYNYLHLTLPASFIQCPCSRVGRSHNAKNAMCIVKSFPPSVLSPSVTRFRHFVENLEIFNNIFSVYLVFGKVLSPLWHNSYAFLCKFSS